jgi:hypothetical protein
MASFRDISSRPASVLIPHAANISQRRQQLAPPKLELLSRKCAIRGFGVRQTLRYAAGAEMAHRNHLSSASAAGFSAAVR